MSGLQAGCEAVCTFCDSGLMPGPTGVGQAQSGRHLPEPGASVTLRFGRPDNDAFNERGSALQFPI